MLKLAREDLASLTRVEESRGSRRSFGGAERSRPDRIRLSVLDAQRGVRTREATLVTDQAQLQRFWAAAAPLAAQIRRRGQSGRAGAGRTRCRLTQAVALAEQNRPDIVSLRRQIAQARSAIARGTDQGPARRSRPRWDTSINTRSAMAWPMLLAYTATVNVSVPLFDRNQGNIAKAQSALVQSSFNLQAQLVQTEADIEQAVAEFQAAYTDVTFDRRGAAPGRPSVRDRTECRLPGRR